MTEKTLIVICIALLLLVVLLLLVLLSRKPKSAQNGNDTGMDTVKEKLDKLGGVADYTNKAITSSWARASKSGCACAEVFLTAPGSGSFSCA